MKRFLVLAACMVLLSGCTQSNIVNPESETKIADPNFDIQDDIEIDWTQVSADAESVFEDTVLSVQQRFPFPSGTAEERSHAGVGGIR